MPQVRGFRSELGSCLPTPAPCVAAAPSPTAPRTPIRARAVTPGAISRWLRRNLVHARAFADSDGGGEVRRPEPQGCSQVDRALSFRRRGGPVGSKFGPAIHPASHIRARRFPSARLAPQAPGCLGDRTAAWSATLDGRSDSATSRTGTTLGSGSQAARDSLRAQVTWRADPPGHQETRQDPGHRPSHPRHPYPPHSRHRLGVCSSRDRRSHPPELRRSPTRRRRSDHGELPRASPRLLCSPQDRCRADSHRQRLGVPQLRRQRRLLPSRSPPSVDEALHTQDQRRGRKPRPDAATRVGLPPGLPKLEGTQGRPQDLRPSLQSPSTPWRPRLQALDCEAPRLVATLPSNDS